jgi:ribonuclease E
MSKEIYISSTPHETRLAIVENEALTEIYYERENEYTLAGSIYNGKVTRVLPGMQSSFVDIGLDRDAFLYITDFMEEVADPGEFESTSTAGDSTRAPRDGGRTDRGGRSDRSDRGDRNTQRGPRTIDVSASEPAHREPTDDDLFTAAVSGLDPARPVSDSERGERSGSRRGGRNRRDRDRNNDGSQHRDRPSGDRPAAPAVDAPIAESVISSPPAVEAGDLGEGAPGADGSRRWRGRRGRRGNRGQDRGQGAEQPRAESAAPVADEAPARTESTGPIYNSYPADTEASENVHEVEASAGPVAEVPATERAPRGDRNDRGGREDRGGRGDRNRGDRGPRSPRGRDSNPAHGSAEPAPYGTEDLGAAPIEPIILPGESLSKYRPGSETPASTAAAPTPAPKSEFVAAGWDGGLVLPGETIRPRAASHSSQTDAPREFNRRDDRGSRNDRGNDRGDRKRSDRRDDRGPRQDRPQHIEATPQPEPQEVVVAVAAPETHAVVSEPERFTPEVAHVDSTFVPPPPMPVAVEPEPAHVEPTPVEMTAVELEPTPELAPEPTPIPVVEHEYEPSEASASYRVDPVAPSEFRQSAPVMEEEVFEEEVFEEETIPEPAAPAHIPDVVHIPEVVHEFEPVSGHDESAHEVTAIFATGEMYAESPALITQELLAAAPSAQGAEHSATPVPADIIAADQTIPWFAPGTGIIEEEMLDDDEEHSVLPAIHARYDEPQEQETLENAADLGTMLREMSIDHLTRTGPSVDEEDDFEEDFLEEDQDDSTEAPEGDEFEDEESDQPEYNLEEGGEAEEETDRAPFPGESEEATSEASGERAPAPAGEAREPRRDRGRDDRGRRDGRRGDRKRSNDRGTGERARSTGGGDHRGGRPSMQTTNLPAISDLLKPGQEILCQIAKEPIAKKGARITSHIALPGRFLVFMPTVNHIGVSRKIESDGERRRLKEILLSEKGDASGGFIVRTAASGASEEELRSDLRFLLNLWADIKSRSESSKSPALIYHDLNLVERVLRDQVTDNFSAIWVDTEAQYEQVLRFLQRFQPSLIRRVKLYSKETPLFEQFGITDEINKALRSKVWLKSGGSIVINQTEALVAIDINTGKFVGKTARLEDTIVKTNLDAIPEIVRQIRLRDLGGIIIIDFIDMDERKNRNKVMAALEDELKSDRAPSKVLPFNDFGLVAITRKRVKQSLERTLSTTCGVCQGTGMTKSPVTVCNDIYIEMRKMQKHLDRGDVMLRVHPEVVKQLKSGTSRWLQEMEDMVGKTILVKSDPSLHPEQFDIH